MDILAARKKAAEKSKSRPEEPAPASAAEPVPAQESDAAAPCEPVSAEPVSQKSEPDSQQAEPASLPADTVPQQPEPESQPTEPDSRPAETVPQTPVAQPPDTASDDERTKETAELELLSFRLGTEEYAVMVDDVREVLKQRELTPVPSTPEYLLGVTSLRGTILAVIDLGRKLGLAPRVPDDRARIVVVSTDEEDVGLMVDRVTGVLKIMPEGIKPPPENVEQGSEYLRGIVRRGDRLVILLDLAKTAGA